MKIFGRPLEAKIFSHDRDKKNPRPKTFLSRYSNPDDILKPRRQYLRDSSESATMVVVDGFPFQSTLGAISYFFRKTVGSEKFDWAYAWKNGIGSGAEFEMNIVLLTTGHQFDSPFFRG
jgi:hypothetical protein